MLHIAELENILMDDKSLKERNINYTVFHAYCTTKQTESDILNFHDIVWDEEIEEIVSDLRRYGLQHFTISSGQSGIIETLWKFEQHGCKVDGMTQVKTKYTDFMTGEQKIVPAFLVKL